jgi:hypothetical protein
MTQSRKHALIFLKKSANDEALIDLILPHGNISDDIFGFHCQQAVEKLLKALLATLSVQFKNTHNLRVLVDLLTDNGKVLPPVLHDIDLFNPYAILLRYEEIDPAPPNIDRSKFQNLIQQLRIWVTQSIKQEDEK